MNDALSKLVEWGDAQDVDWHLDREGDQYSINWPEPGNRFATFGVSPYEAAAKAVAELEERARVV